MWEGSKAPERYNNHRECIWVSLVCKRWPMLDSISFVLTALNPKLNALNYAQLLLEPCLSRAHLQGLRAKLIIKRVSVVQCLQTTTRGCQRSTDVHLTKTEHFNNNKRELHFPVINICFGKISLRYISTWVSERDGWFYTELFCKQRSADDSWV